MRARRTDANMKEIVEALRSAGCSVHVTNGMWDLTIGHGGLSMLLELKDGSKPPSARRYTPSQDRWRETWTGGCRLILSPSDALEAANTLRRWAMMLRQAHIQPTVYESGAD